MGKLALAMFFSHRHFSMGHLLLIFCRWVEDKVVKLEGFG